MVNDEYYNSITDDDESFSYFIAKFTETMETHEKSGDEFKVLTNIIDMDLELITAYTNDDDYNTNNNNFYRVAALRHYPDTWVFNICDKNFGNDVIT